MYAIMIVDDETLIRRGLSNMIARSGQPFYVAGMAVNGADAVEKIARINPDVIISDICMPDMDGLTLADYLRKTYPEIITVILSGYNEFSYAQSAIQNKVFSYLLKPLGMEDVQRLLCELRQELEKRILKREESALLRLYTSGKVSFLYSLVKRRELILNLDTLQTAEVQKIISELLDHMQQAHLDLVEKKKMALGIFRLAVQTMNTLTQEDKEKATQLLEQMDLDSEISSSAQLEQYMVRQADLLMDIVRKSHVSNEQITVERIKQYINQHYCEKLSLSVLANEFGFNPSYLSDFFKRNAGQNFLEYVNQVRVQHAIQLLKNHGMKVTDIAIQVGYDNANCFTRVFKKVVGKTPDEYRRLSEDAGDEYPVDHTEENHCL